MFVVSKVGMVTGLVSVTMPTPTNTDTTQTHIQEQLLQKQARKLQATIVRNSAQRLTDSLTGVKCRATSVAKKIKKKGLQSQHEELAQGP